MKQFKSKEILKFLKKNGFVEDHFTGSHLILYHPKLKIRTTLPMHLKDIPIWTLRAILRQTGLTIDDMKDFFKF